MIKLNNYEAQSAYQYTFDAEMAKCAKKPQNYFELVQEEKTKNSGYINYNNVWSRENYDDCFGTAAEGHNYSEYGTVRYLGYPFYYFLYQVLKRNLTRVTVDMNVYPQTSQS